jgi:hypothetical protein
MAPSEPSKFRVQRSNIARRPPVARPLAAKTSGTMSVRISFHPSQ